jgi:hypothetical protein
MIVNQITQIRVVKWQIGPYSMDCHAGEVQLEACVLQGIRKCASTITQATVVM